MRVLIVLSAIVACALAQTCSDKELKQYKEWQRKFNRPVYDKEKELKKCSHFLRALLHIKNNNANPNNHKTALNGLSDLSPEEFATRLGGKKPDNYKHEAGTQKVRRSTGSYPESRDWRDHNMVTHVKNQADCSSCWAFATVGAIEGAHSKQSGKLVSLSEQDLVDCVSENLGCNGGWQFDAYKNIIKRGGIDTEKSYPYVSGTTSSANAECTFDKSQIGAKIKDYVNIPSYDPEAMLEVVGNIGPVVVSLDARYLQHYSSGVFNSPDCVDSGGQSTNHAVLIVGYGTDTTNSTGFGDFPYWIIKNSWGNWWGEDGYVKMSRDKSRIPNCGLEQMPSYVTV